MRNLLRNRRGSVALATVAALVPVIGFVALGAEAGSWYVTKQHAQNAADAAAVAGALKVACDLGSAGGSVGCSDLQPYDYRGRQFAAQNSFCGSTDATAYPGSSCTAAPTGITRSVTMAQPTASRVQATVTQTQPAFLAKLLGMSTVTVGATAIAEVQNPLTLCALGLGRYPKGSALTLGGNNTNAGNGCALMSNDTVKYNGSPTFTGTGWSVNAAKGCLPNGNQCNSPGVPYNYFQATAFNPLKILDTQTWNTVSGATNTAPLNQFTTGCPPAGAPAGTNKCYNVTPNRPGSGAYKDLSVSTKDYVNFAPGTYFFYNAAIKINGGMVVCTACNATLGVTLVLLGDSSISITGGTVILNAPNPNTFSPLLSGILINDQAPNASKNAVTINGGGSVKLGGSMYFPNVDVTYNGGAQNANTTCSAVIANTLDLGGGSYMSSDNCVAGSVSKTQFVFLVPS